MGSYVRRNRSRTPPEQQQKQQQQQQHSTTDAVLLLSPSSSTSTFITSTSTTTTSSAAATASENQHPSQKKNRDTGRIDRRVLLERRKQRSMETHEKIKRQLQQQQQQCGSSHSSNNSDGGVGASASTASIVFTTGNPNVEEIFGVIHLYQSRPQRAMQRMTKAGQSQPQQQQHYREKKRKKTKSALSVDTYAAAVAARSKSTLSSHDDGDEIDDDDGDNNVEDGGSGGVDGDSLPEWRSNLVCVLAVPSFMSTRDFCDFVACFRDHIRLIRIVRDESPNKYMVLMELDSQESADSFYLQYNGKKFNSFDPEDCKVVFVSKVELIAQLNDAGDDTVALGKLEESNEFGEHHLARNSGKQPSSSSSSSIVATSNTVPDDMDSRIKVELPSCPVCLERLDSESSGIITTMCNHRFHCDCLTKWGDGTCPVCRYSQDESESLCEICGSKEDLWICLTCGCIGCGRYNGGHAHEHFERTKHTYSMQIETQRVWDYVGDGYVHRLIQNKTDGKLVEIPTPDGRQSTVDHDMIQAQLNSKQDAVEWEYNQLLSEQLLSQRVHYEKEMRQMTREKDAIIDKLLEELAAERKQAGKLTKSAAELQERLKRQEKEFAAMKRLNDALINEQRRVKSKLDSNTVELKKKLDSKDVIINDLQEQLKDLMLHIETQQTLAKNKNKDEIEGASVTVQETLRVGGGKLRRKKGGR